MHKLSTCLGLAALALALSSGSQTAHAGDAKVKSMVIAKGLTHPTGLTVHPKTGDVYICDSGAGRVVRVDMHNPGKVIPVITGFELDLYGKGPKYPIGPLDVGFVDNNTLIVSGGGHEDGKELIYAFDLKSHPKTPADAIATYGPIKAGADSAKGEGNFHSIAITKKAVFVSSNGDDTKGWVVKIDLPIKKGMNQKLIPYIATKMFITTTNAPGGTAINKGKLVVGQMGAVNKPRDSWLTVYDPETGKGLAKAETGLYDITGVAVSPKSGKLFCTDFAWMAPKDGGVYRLELSHKDGDLVVMPVKIISLLRPTALAFSANGDLFVAVNGEASQGAKKKTGYVIQLKVGH